jgi:hypothetical protein
MERGAAVTLRVAAAAMARSPVPFASESVSNVVFPFDETLAFRLIPF